MPAQMTSTALDRGIKNAALCTGALVIVFGLGSYILSAATGRSLTWSYGVFGSVAYGSILAAFFVLWVRSRKNRGPVVLDCGPHPTRWLFLFLAIFVPLLSLFTLFIAPSERSIWVFGGPALMLLTGPFYLAMGTGRLQITELGLWQYWSLLPWEKINSVRWAHDSTLLIQGKGRFSALARGALPVPPEHRAAIVNLLAQHGVTTTA